MNDQNDLTPKESDAENELIEQQEVQDRADPQEQADQKTPEENSTSSFDAKEYWKSLNETDEKPDDQPQEYWTSFTDHGISDTSAPGYGEIPEEYRSSGFTKAAMTCGILSIVTALFNLSLPFAALGILFALLSRDRKFSRQAKTALGLCTAGLVVFAVTISVSIYLLVSTGIWSLMMDRISTLDPSDPYAVTELQRELISELEDRIYERYTGQSRSGSTGSSTGEKEKAAYLPGEKEKADAAETESKPRVVLGRDAYEDSGAAASGTVSGSSSETTSAPSPEIRS